jgi:hypothetical protein
MDAVTSESALKGNGGRNGTPCQFAVVDGVHGGLCQVARGRAVALSRRVVKYGFGGRLVGVAMLPGGR